MTLKQRREELGLSAETAASYCNVSLMTILRWETGKYKPRADKWEILTIVYQLDSIEKLMEILNADQTIPASN